jgi:hypothetical protein
LTNFDLSIMILEVLVSKAGYKVEFGKTAVASG